MVHGFARELSHTGLNVKTLATDKSGYLAYQSEIPEIQSDSDQFVLFWQHTNRETGIQQRDLDCPIPSNSLLIADMTAAFHVADKPRDWGVALWDSRSFGGQRVWQSWRFAPIQSGNHLFPRLINVAYLAPIQNLYFCLPRLLFDERVKEAERESQYLQDLRRELREMICHRITGVKIVGDSEKTISRQANPRQLALVADGVAAEEILRQLEKSGVLIDAGSACWRGRSLTEPCFRGDGIWRERSPSDYSQSNPYS